MKDKTKSIFKKVIAIITILLIAGALFIINGFAGNPISRVMANRAIEKHVDQNYPHLDLEIEKPKYNFKIASYMARAESTTSIDTKFAIYYGDGKVQRDDYENYVLGMFNTLQRLSDEYSSIARNIMAKKLGYEKNTTIVLYNNNERTNNILELDMEFDRTLPIDSEVLIRFDSEDNSLESMAKVLTDAHKAFVENDCNFNEYSLSIENDGSYASVHGTTPTHIESGNLIDILKEAEKNDGANGVGYFIKGKNK